MSIFNVLIKRTFRMKGRAGRKEYWIFTLLIIFFILLVGGMQTNIEEVLFSDLLGVIGMILALSVSIPIQVRRWHDRNKSGWFVCINLIPVIGSVWSLIELGCIQGTNEENKYGKPLS